MKTTLFPLIYFAMYVVASYGQESPIPFSGEPSKEAIIRQIIPSGILSESGVTIFQSGHSNELNFMLKGTGNSATGLQIGNFNDMSLDMDAQNSRFYLEQYGNGNNIDLTNMNGNGINFELTQRQNNNSLVLDGGSHIPSLKIEQSGGMQLTIQSNMPLLK